MAVLTPNLTDGADYFDGTKDLTAFTHDDAADSKTGATYTHNAKQCSATELNAIVSTLLFIADAFDFAGNPTDGNILVADGTAFESVAVTGDIGIDNTGLTAITSGAIVNADVNAAAAIAWTKIDKTGAVPSDVGSGTIAAQDADSVTITGGSIDGTVIGNTTIADADLRETTVKSNGNYQLQGYNSSGTKEFEFEPDGTLVFYDTATVWEDANLGVISLQSPATAPGIVEFLDGEGASTGVYGRGFAVTESLSGCIEIPHAAKAGSDVQFHVHWTGNAAPSGTDYVRWKLIYFSVADGELTPSATSVEFETAFDTQYERMTSAVTLSIPEPMDQFCFTLARITATGDAYAGDAVAMTIGLHYEVDTLGSRTITTK